MILVFGATGSIGGSALRELAGAGQEVRAFCRDPSKLASVGPNVEVVQGDLDQPDTVAPALAGVDRLLLLSTGPGLVNHEAMVIEQAATRGVEHIVLISSAGVEHGVGSGPFHKPGEERLRASGLQSTILRGVEFMTNAFRWRDEIRARGTFSEPTGAGRRAMIDPADIGAVAATVLTSTGHEGHTYELTGPEALTGEEYAQRLSSATGKEIHHCDIPESAYAEVFVRMGLPAPVVDSVVRFYSMVRDGSFDYVTPHVEEITGRPARTFGAWAEANASAFL
jgi:uncharacterized protein YbjT (DUF2867 family)